MKGFSNHTESGGTGRRAVTNRGRARRAQATTIAAAMSAVLLVASPAAAAVPEVVEQAGVGDIAAVPLLGQIRSIVGQVHVEFTADNNVVLRRVDQGGGLVVGAGGTSSSRSTSGSSSGSVKAGSGQFTM